MLDGTSPLDRAHLSSPLNNTVILWIHFWSSPHDLILSGLALQRCASSPKNLLIQAVSQKCPPCAKQHFNNVVGTFKIISKIYHKCKGNDVVIEMEDARLDSELKEAEEAACSIFGRSMGTR